MGLTGPQRSQRSAYAVRCSWFDGCGSDTATVISAVAHKHGSSVMWYLLILSSLSLLLTVLINNAIMPACPTKEYGRGKTSWICGRDRSAAPPGAALAGSRLLAG